MAEATGSTGSVQRKAASGGLFLVRQQRGGNGLARQLFTSESVTECHPDKVADQVSDAILDEILRQDPMARVAAETLVTTGLVVVSGEISTEA